MACAATDSGGQNNQHRTEAVLHLFILTARQIAGRVRWPRKLSRLPLASPLHQMMPRAGNASKSASGFLCFRLIKHSAQFLGESGLVRNASILQVSLKLCWSAIRQKVVVDCMLYPKACAQSNYFDRF